MKGHTRFLVVLIVIALMLPVVPLSVAAAEPDALWWDWGYDSL